MTVAGIVEAGDAAASTVQTFGKCHIPVRTIWAMSEVESNYVLNV
jgi:hypothetical protein